MPLFVSVVLSPAAMTPLLSPFSRTSSRRLSRYGGTSALIWPLGALLLCTALAAGAAAPPRKQRGSGASAGSKVAADPIRFNRDIRPILSDNCYFCHGPDKNHRQAGLRLDLREVALAKGALVPGHPEKSELLKRIGATPGSGMIMPPDSVHKTITPAQKALLARWIAAGAPYEPHWAYVAPQRDAALPVVRDIIWAKNPIDHFILARLEKENIRPSPEADRRTLLRRVSLDLTGLPPTPGELQTFLADKRPDAYEHAVDRLLASPRYGERMAVPWLDTVRYADTVGFHGDQNQNAWAYRDWVIDAFNRNLPFDRFTIDQIAGDLLPGATDADRTATCFNRLNMMTREGGAQDKEYLAKSSADRVRTVSMTWLGSTFACAECHDHKYDPITQRDFYSLAAFFADVKQWGVYADYGYTSPELRGYNNDSPFPPEITVESRYLKARMAQQQKVIDLLAATAVKAAPADALIGWRKSASAFLAAHPDGWEIPLPKVAATAPKKGDPAPPLTTDSDKRVVQATAAAASIELTIPPADAGSIAAVRLEVLPHVANGNTIFRQKLNSGTVRLTATVHHSDGKAERVPFRYAAADHSHPTYRGGSEVIGVQGGWMLDETRKSEPQTAVYLLAMPVRLAAGDALVLTLPDCPAGSVRVSVSPFVPDDLGRPVLAPAYVTALRTGDDTPATRRAWLMSTAGDATAFAQVKMREAELLACREGRTPVLVTEAVKTPLVTRVLPRGNWQDESGLVVAPGVPHFLPGYKENPGRRLTRLDLARWIVAPENPLTARVFVNRLWKQYFGNGLSGQVEDLGAQGEWPTHPELLDWMAVEFRKSGWDIKHMVRLIVTSAAYRQSSSLRPELRERDPNNRLLASQNPRRLEAEFVRDNALAVAGLLNTDLVGGPPDHPYQPAGYYAAIQFPDRDYIAETDERQYRRGVYSHRQRTFLHPMLANFDAPSREDATCTRTVANTPQQALTLLNDPEFVEAARVLAADLLRDSTAGEKGDTVRLNRLYERALSRYPRPAERASLLSFLAKIRQEYRARPEDAKKLLHVGLAPTPEKLDPVEGASWTTVCRVVLNLQETITRY